MLSIKIQVVEVVLVGVMSGCVEDPEANAADNGVLTSVSESSFVSEHSCDGKWKVSDASVAGFVPSARGLSPSDLEVHRKLASDFDLSIVH